VVLAQSNRDQCGVLVLEKELVTSSNVRRSCASTEDQAKNVMGCLCGQKWFFATMVFQLQVKKKN
jgi:hypothetical protein